MTSESIYPRVNNAGLKTDIVNRGGKKYFMKEAPNENALEALEREYWNQRFLLEATGDKGFSFFEIEKDDNRIFYPFVENIEWYGQAHFGKILQNTSGFKPLSEYQEAVFQFFNFCHSVEFKDLPEALQIDRTTEEWEKRFEAGLNICLGKDLLCEDKDNEVSESEALRAFFDGAKDKRAYQHHDVMPYHIGRYKGKLFLIDPGWGRWSLHSYDMAYYILEMGCYVQSKDDVKNFVNSLLKLNRSNEKEFLQNLYSAMAYRAMVLIPALLDKDGQEYLEAAHRVLGIMLGQRNLQNK